MQYNKKYYPGRIVRIIKNPPGIEPLDDVVGQVVPIERVEHNKFIIVAGYKIQYVFASKHLQLLNIHTTCSAKESAKPLH